MSQKALHIRFIGYSLAILYAASFLVFLQESQWGAYQNLYLFAAGIFAILFVSAVTVTQQKDWGRVLLISGNLLFMLVLVVLYLNTKHYSTFPYLCLSLVVLLYFNKSVIEERFKIKAKSRWKSVLIIDDDEGQLKTLRPLLITNGYAVLTAANGEIGLNIARSQHPDLILLDVILPGIKGREVCVQIKKDEATKDIPVVFLTAKDSDDDILAEMEAGGELHLTKPVREKDLISTIRSLIG